MRAGKRLKIVHADNRDGAARAHRIERVAHRGVGADGVNHRVCAATPRRGQNRLGRRSRYRRSTPGGRALQASLYSVDSENRCGTVYEGAAQRAEADGSQADDRHGGAE